MAYRLASDSDCVVAIGGDGTAHQVGRGVISSGASASMGLLPAGTGNDYARSIGIPAKPEDALKALVEGRERAVDYGVVEWTEEGVEDASIFLNVLGIGFDAMVARRAASHSPARGLMRYVFSAVRQLPSWRGLDVTIGDPESPESLFAGRLFLVSIGNGATAGGGFHLTPQAEIDDGYLDACIVRQMSVMRALSLLPLAVVGKHIGAPEVDMVRTKQLRVQSTDLMPIHADGEILSTSATQARIRVVARALRIMTAAPGNLEKSAESNR